MGRVNTKTLAALLCFLLAVSIGLQMAEATKLCARLSQTWTGPCTRNCNNKCRRWERAQHGACHWRGLGFACYCYYNC